MFDLEVSAALFGKTRRKVLAVLFGRPDEQFYLREMVRLCDGGTGAVQRELKRLVAAGLVARTHRDKQVYFQAERSAPIFKELERIVVKTAGAVEVLRAGLAPLAKRIAVAFVFGSVTEGRQTRASDIDLAVIGEAGFGEIVQTLAEAQQTLGREVNPVTYSPREFAAKLADGEHFVRRLAQAKKLFLIGTADELERLATQRVARRTSHERGGNRRSPGRHRARPA